jgi:uncharacterized protein (DUF433 family)
MRRSERIPTKTTSPKPAKFLAVPHREEALPEEATPLFFFALREILRRLNRAVSIRLRCLLPAGFARYHDSMTTNTTTPEIVSPETVVPVIGEYIALTPGFCGGKPHIIGHRIKVQHIVVWHERMGRSPEEIAVTYNISLPVVFAALAY